MRLATFTERQSTRIGVIVGDEICDLSHAKEVPSTMVDFLNGGKDAMEAARRSLPASRRIPLGQLRLEAPVLAPRKFLGLGGSYESHLKETSHLMPRPKHQSWFNKQVTSINGPYDPIHKPRVSDTLDFEGELAIVIGQRGRHRKGQAALDMIAGFTVCNDVSVREWQMRSPTATLGKSFDTHGPLGPWIVTADEIPDPHNLWLRTWVNGEMRQNGNTNDLVYQFLAMSEEQTAVFTLEPGDILSTGSPAGVGGAQKPPIFLQVGDVVKVEVEGIGHIKNRVIPEPEPSM